jgi:transcriptional regulator with XRE-family HTH domain
MGRYTRAKPERLTEKLIGIRRSLGLSQNGMLDRLGLAESRFRSSISSFELGKSQPSLPVLLQYARAAGVCMDVLVDDHLDLPGTLPGTPVHKGVLKSHNVGRRKPMVKCSPSK